MYQKVEETRISRTNIFLFTEKYDICNFADGKTLFTSGDNLSAILKSLGHDMKILLRWLNSNSFKVNPGKFQF